MFPVSIAKKAVEDQRSGIGYHCTMRILVSGTFDNLHPGHIFLLKEAMARVSESRSDSAKATPDKNPNAESSLWVIVARDSNVLKIKGRAALQTEGDRQRAIEYAFPDAHVILGDNDDFLKPVRDINPDLILLGYDQHLPPHITEADLPWKTERLTAFDPHIHKSSIRRAEHEKNR